MTDFLHFIFPFAPETKERKLAREILTQLKGGEGSGNFGHAGRPGEVGGSSSGDNFIGKSWGFDVYKVNDGQDILDKYYSIAVAVKGKNNGIVLASKDPLPHSAIINVYDPSDSIDNYVRFRNENFILTASTYFAGVTAENAGDDDKAINNIYKALDKLTNIGLPISTQVHIEKMFSGGVVDTTAKEFIEELS